VVLAPDNLYPVIEAEVVSRARGLPGHDRFLDALNLRHRPNLQGALRPQVDDPERDDAQPRRQLRVHRQVRRRVVESPLVAIRDHRAVVEAPFRMSPEVTVVRRLIDLDVNEHLLALDRWLLDFAQTSQIVEDAGVVIVGRVFVVYLFQMSDWLSFVCSGCET